jgi:hypothetical protein
MSMVILNKMSEAAGLILYHGHDGAKREIFRLVGQAQRLTIIQKGIPAAYRSVVCLSAGIFESSISNGKMELFFSPPPGLFTPERNIALSMSSK